MFKNKYSGIIIFFVSLMICLLILELSLLLIMEDEEFWEYDPILGTTHLKEKTGLWCTEEFCHQFTTNNEGFIDQDFSENKKLNEKRIFIFGDSFIEAVQVEMADGTAWKLEQKFENNRQENVESATIESYNFGTSNHGPTQYLLSLKKYGPKYKPDLVIFAIFTQNDLRNINSVIELDQCQPFLQKDGSINYPNCTPGLFKKIAQNFKSFRYLQKAIKLYKHKAHLAKTDFPIHFRIYDPSDKDLKESFELLEIILKEAEKVSEQLNSEFMVVTLTNPIQLDKSILDLAKEQYPLLETKYLNLGYPEQEISRICDELNLNCLNLLYPFRENIKNKQERLHFPKDGHWNEKGHQLATEEIYQFILSKKLI